MGISSSALVPDDLIPFKKLNPGTNVNELNIPERPENRTLTNRRWFFVLLGFVVVLLPFLIYTLVYSDIHRFWGYDPCGNSCGTTNAKYDGISCSGQDMTSKKYLKFYPSSSYSERRTHSEIPSILLTERECVEDCGPDYKEVMNLCIKTDGTKTDDVAVESLNMEVGGYFNKVAWQLTVGSFISLGIAVGMLFLFRYAVAAVVWSILIGCLASFTILVVFLWYIYSTRPSIDNFDRNDLDGLLYINIVLSVVVLVLALILLFARKKIWLVIALLKETTKAVFSLPGIILVPVAAIAANLILLLIFVILELYMLTAGKLEALNSRFYFYDQDFGMLFSMAFLAAMFVWFSQIIVGIKYMVIAGAVSDWYFAKNKQFLNGPIMRSAAITFTYHLGTIIFGSFIITVMVIIRAVITSLIKNEHFKRFMESCCKSIETFLKFLSKNAYILTAIHGQPFFKSGKRAAKLLIQNVGDVVAINSIGDFVLGMTQLLIVILSVAITYGLLLLEPTTNDNTIGLVFALLLMTLISIIISATIFSVFETTIDTIFICFCEDSLLNDGMSRPYCMSTNLMEFVQNSKKVYTKS